MLTLQSTRECVFPESGIVGLYGFIKITVENGLISSILDFVSLCWDHGTLFRIKFLINHTCSYPSEIRCSICVRCFFNKFVYAFEMVGHNLTTFHVGHFDVIFLLFFEHNKNQ